MVSSATKQAVLANIENIEPNRPQFGGNHGIDVLVREKTELLATSRANLGRSENVILQEVCGVSHGIFNGVGGQMGIRTDDIVAAGPGSH